MSGNARGARADTHRMRGAWGIASERNSICSVIVPADGTRTAIVGSGEFGTSPLYLGSSRASRCFARI
jgi:hypothetical protein